MTRARSFFAPRAGTAGVEAREAAAAALEAATAAANGAPSDRGDNEDDDNYADDDGVFTTLVSGVPSRGLTTYQ